MMNVLYAGIDNPMSISVPGVAPSAISASMTNGTLSRQGDKWVARPGKVGTEAVITVTANIDGRPQTVATNSFRVRKLPDPTPYIAFNDSKGNAERYKGGKPFSKTLLLQAPGIEAAIDDDLLNVTYKVLSFETVFFDSMGNAIPEVSSGASFSQRQKDSFRRLSRGKRFYISRVRAVGPDGIERDLAPMEGMARTICAQQQSSSSSSSVVRKGSADARKKADSSSPNVTERMQQFFEEPERSDADAQWMKIVYRQLDLEKVKNAPLYYPEEVIDGQENLFRIIMRLLANGDIKAYEYLDGHDSKPRGRRAHQRGAILLHPRTLGTRQAV